MSKPVPVHLVDIGVVTPPTHPPLLSPFRPKVIQYPIPTGVTAMALVVAGILLLMVIVPS